MEQAPPSPDYVPGPEHQPSPDYVPGPEYPEYVALADDEIPEDPKEDPVDYPADGGDDDDEEEEEESSEDDNDEEEEEEPFEEDKEEKEHIALTDSAALPVTDLVPSAEETEPFEIDESAPAPPPPRSPRTKVPFSQTRLPYLSYRARPVCQTLAIMDNILLMALNYRICFMHLLLRSPPPSPLSPFHPHSLGSHQPLNISPTYAEAPLGYRAAMIQLRAASPPHVPSPPLLLSSTNHRSDILKTDMPFQKRLCLTALDSRFEVGESSTIVVARQTGHTLARRDAHELYVRDEDA
ncbi:hypothetical protein Tco_0603716 [Tanacetum coccineum]